MNKQGLRNDEAKGRKGQQCMRGQQYMRGQEVVRA